MYRPCPTIEADSDGRGIVTVVGTANHAIVLLGFILGLLGWGGKNFHNYENIGEHCVMPGEHGRGEGVLRPLLGLRCRWSPTFAVDLKKDAATLRNVT